MAIAIVSSGKARLEQFGTQSLTTSVSVSGVNTALVVKIGNSGTSTTTGSVSYNGTTVPLAGASGDGGASARAEIYVLPAPSAGSNNLVVTATSIYADSTIIWEVWQGVDQTTPFISGNVVAGNNSYQSSPRSDSITVSTGNVATDMIVANGTADTFTVSGSQTQTQQANVVSSAAASYLLNATAMAWTFAGGGGSNQVAHTVIELKAASGADTTAPTLSSPTGTQTGSTSGSGTVSTNEANGTLYYLATTNATETASTVKAGASQTVTTTGSQAVAFSGLTPSTTYYAHYCHRDAAGNDSTVANSLSFTTTAPVLGGVQTIYARRNAYGTNSFGTRR